MNHIKEIINFDLIRRLSLEMTETVVEMDKKIKDWKSADKIRTLQAFYIFISEMLEVIILSKFVGVEFDYMNTTDKYDLKFRDMILSRIMVEEEFMKRFLSSIVKHKRFKLILGRRRMSEYLKAGGFYYDGCRYVIINNNIYDQFGGKHNSDEFPEEFENSIPLIDILTYSEFSDIRRRAKIIEVCYGSDARKRFFDINFIDYECIIEMLTKCRKEITILWFIKWRLMPDDPVSESKILTDYKESKIAQDIDVLADEANDHLFDVRKNKVSDCYCPECNPNSDGIAMMPEMKFYSRNDQHILLFQEDEVHIFLRKDFHRIYIMDKTPIMIFNFKIRDIQIKPKYDLRIMLSKLTWDEKDLDHVKLITLENNEVKRINCSDQKYIFISHIWELPDNPDPFLQTTLLSLKRHKYVWIDFLSLPQGEEKKDPHFNAYFKRMLHSMYNIQSESEFSVKIVPDWAIDEYNHRGWCIAEQSLIGESPMLDVLYRYTQIYGFQKSLSILRIHLSDMSDAEVIKSYFGLKGGGYKYSIDNMNDHQSNGKIRNVIKKLKTINYELPYKYRIEISITQNILCVDEVSNQNFRRSLIRRIDKSTPRKMKKRTHHAYMDHHILHNPSTIYWVDEMDQVKDFFCNRLPKMIPHELTIRKCKKPVIPSSRFYKNLCKGKRISENLTVDEISVINTTKLRRFFFWCKDVSFITILRYPEFS